MSVYVSKDGRAWVLEGSEPYTRRDGTLTRLLVWASVCVKCGARVEGRTPEGGTDRGKLDKTKHCFAHLKKGGRPRLPIGETGLVVTVRLTPARRDKLRALGAAWLAAAIDSATDDLV